MTMANYGKGVAFWETDHEASRFVNDFQDVVSVDAYWFTDPNICSASEGGTLLQRGRALTPAECRLAANYGRTIDRVRNLMAPGRKKPVWAFVEVGHPATESSAPTITGPEIRAAVWSSLIHGARGIVYFNHSFGGDCKSQHLLRDSCGAEVRPEVTRVNQQISRLAPVLNAPFVDGAVSSAKGADVVAKFKDRDVYLFSTSSGAAAHTATIAIPCVGTATADVIDEGRSVDITDGRLMDQFQDGNTVHLYHVRSASGCKPRMKGR